MARLDEFSYLGGCSAILATIACSLAITRVRFCKEYTVRSDCQSSACSATSDNGVFGRPDSPTGLPAEPSQHRARPRLVTVARVDRSSRCRGRVGV